MPLEPTMHLAIPLGSKVKTKEGMGYPSLKGEVTGIAYAHIFFSYVVSLDSDYFFTNEYGTHKAVCLPGQGLELL
jgi:hypothetical protein